MQVDQHWEIAGWQAVAVPRRFQRPAPAEHVEQRQLQPHFRGRHADQHNGPHQVPSVERLLVGLRAADGFNYHVGPVTPGEVLNLLDRVGRARIHRVGRAEAAGPVELPVVDINGDYRPCTGQHGAEYRGIADAAAADHRDRVAAADARRVQRRAEARHHAAAEQPGYLWLDRRVYLGAL